MGTQSRRIARNRTLRPVWVEDITAAQERARVKKERDTAQAQADQAEKVRRLQVKLEDPGTNRQGYVKESDGLWARVKKAFAPLPEFSPDFPLPKLPDPVRGRDV